MLAVRQLGIGYKMGGLQSTCPQLRLGKTQPAVHCSWLPHPADCPVVGRGGAGLGKGAAPFWLAAHLQVKLIPPWSTQQENVCCVQGWAREGGQLMALYVKHYELQQGPEHLSAP